jgi:ubiquinone/menaquinone biosynthesis C-methylase UbiE
MKDQNKIWEGYAAMPHMHEGGRGRLRYVAARVRGLQPAKVLDVGAGKGELMEELKASGIEALGVDAAPASQQVEKGDVRALRWPDGSFDAVTCVETIEHLVPEDCPKLLAELKRVVKPGGHLVLTTPADEKLEDLLCVCPDCGKVFHRWGHLQSFSEEKLRALFESGWELVSVERKAFPDERWGSARKALWHLKKAVKRLIGWPIGEWETFIVTARKAA